MPEAFDDGFEFHRLKPDLLLGEVWLAAERYARPFPILTSDASALARSFVEGYQAARKQRDEAEADKPDASGHVPGGHAMPWIGDTKKDGV